MEKGFNMKSFISLTTSCVFVCVCFVFCIPQWIALLWLWISLAALPGCLAEEAWPISEWLSSGFSCSLRAPTSAGSGPSTRLSSELNVSWQHPDEPASRRNVVFCATASSWWNKMSSARLTRESKTESAVKQSRKGVFGKTMFAMMWIYQSVLYAVDTVVEQELPLLSKEPLHDTTHSFTSLWSWLM